MTPLLHVAQITLNWTDGLIIYGPLGIGWVGMAYFINKLMQLHADREKKMDAREDTRDTLLRETTHEQAEAYLKVAHKLENVYRGMVYMAAVAGDGSLREMAKGELSKMGGKE